MLRSFSLFALTALLGVSSSYAATVSLVGDPLGREPTAAELGGDATLAGKKIYEFRVTTDSDILSVDEVVIDLNGATLYQNAFGSDSEPPLPALVAAFPALSADTWITTPAPDTAIAGGGFANPGSSWFDSTDNGAQANFLFARLTTAGMGTFSGRVNTLGPNGSVDNFGFSMIIGIPEPATIAMAGMGLIGIVACSRRRKA